MSKVKSATEKKELSLKLDRRNTHGENPQSSRKNIARGKQLGHKKERHVVGQILGSVGPEPGQDEETAAELAANVAGRVAKLKGFKKQPDSPLGEVIEKKLARRKRASPEVE
jgi:hypothetical protein